MIVGQDVTIPGHDDAGAQSLFPALARQLLERHAEELAQERIFQKRRHPLIGAGGLVRIYIHHAGRDLADHRFETENRLGVRPQRRGVALEFGQRGGCERGCEQHHGERRHHRESAPEPGVTPWARLWDNTHDGIHGIRFIDGLYC